ncbi:hypothetical protein GCM10020358_74710 [Amorphoplanes nipponensis]
MKYAAWPHPASDGSREFGSSRDAAERAAGAVGAADPGGCGQPAQREGDLDAVRPVVVQRRRHG